MLEIHKGKQQRIEVVTLEEMIPKDHLLRKIDSAVDFSFINEICAPLYCADNGRPAIEPETLFRMLIVGYLYGVKSETRLEEEVNYNMAYKWFCRLGLTEKAPDATTISQNRRRRFRDNDIAEKIFDEILRQCVEKGLVGGQILYTDSTHVKAKANKHRKRLIEIDETPKVYMEELDAQIDRDRKALGKKPFDRDGSPKDNSPKDGSSKDGSPKDNSPKDGLSKDGSPKDGSPKDRTTTRMESLTDPDSGQLSKEGKPDGFHYSEHRTVDSKNNVIVNVRLTAANINDVTPVPEILKDIEMRLGTLPKYMGFDAGYHNAYIAHLLETNGIQGVIGHRRHTRKGETYGKWRFKYDRGLDAYICPEKRYLYWKTTNREGYREYCSSGKTCKECPRRKECFSEKATRRVVTRHVWQDALDEIITFTKTVIGKKLYAWRKETIERSFAEAKDNHCLRYARMLGIKNMHEQSFLTAAVQNMKRLAKRFCSHFFVTLLCNPCTHYTFITPRRFEIWGLSGI